MSQGAARWHPSCKTSMGNRWRYGFTRGFVRSSTSFFRDAHAAHRLHGAALNRDRVPERLEPDGGKNRNGRPDEIRMADPGKCLWTM